MKAEIELAVTVFDLEGFIELFEGLEAGLERIEKDSLDTTAKFWASRTLNRIEAFYAKNKSESIKNLIAGEFLNIAKDVQKDDGANDREEDQRYD